VRVVWYRAASRLTVLFADVVHSIDSAAAVGVERLREVMAELADRCAEVVRRYGGTVDKFTATASWWCSARRWRWKTTRSVHALRLWPLRGKRCGSPSRSKSGTVWNSNRGWV
jgi:hypothetical protein